MDSGEFSLSQPLVAEPARAKTRIVALDVYRGLVMFGMIIADCQVDGYSFVSHAHWDGLTGIDLIFPSFLFIMGLSIPLSIRGSFGYRPLVRTLEMLAIGLFLNLQVDNFHFQEWRFPGVLQRIALCYLVVAVLHWLSDYGKHLYVQISAAIVLSVCYISFMVGESHSQGCSHLTPECNFGRDIDSAIFGDKHLMQPTDPEGILSTCTSVVTSLGGYFVSLIMQKHKENKSRMLTQQCKFGVFFLILAAILLWLQPFNKKLWSISYTMLTIGAATISFSLCVLLIDFFPPEAVITKVSRKLTTPFLWLGSNPLAIYVLMMELVALLEDNFEWDGINLETRIMNFLFDSWIGNTKLSSLLFSLLFVLLWTGVALVLYRKQIFIKL